VLDLDLYQLVTIAYPTHSPNLAYLMSDGAAAMYHDVRSFNDKIKAVTV